MFRREPQPPENTELNVGVILSSLLKKGSDPLRPLEFITFLWGLQRVRPLFQPAVRTSAYAFG